MTTHNETVLEKVCAEKHKAVEDKLRAFETGLNDHSTRLNSVEDAVIKLTNVVDSIARKDFFDKILILSVFLICLVLTAIILGPEITGRIIGGLK